MKSGKSKREENFTHGKFLKYMSVYFETRKKAGKRVRLHRFFASNIRHMVATNLFLLQIGSRDFLVDANSL